MITGTVPPYLSNLKLCTPSHTLHYSADTRIFHIPRGRKRFHGQHAVSFIGPSMWTFTAFKSQLKTHLFSVCYSH